MSLFARLPLPLGIIGSLGSPKVGHLDRYLVDDRATRDPLPVDRTSISTCWYGAVMGAEMQMVANFQQYVGIIGATKGASAFNNGLERRFHIGRRGRDRPEHVGGRALLLQGFAQIVGALAQFVLQPGVFLGGRSLARDRRVVGGETGFKSLLELGNQLVEIGHGVRGKRGHSLKSISFAGPSPAS